VRALLTEVFHGRLRAGQHLVARELAKRFGVSQTPIREALIELAAVGIIDLLPNRGAVVRHVTDKDVREIYQVRRLLECEATRRACGRIDLGRLNALADELRQLLGVRALPVARFIAEARRVDSELHDLIAESCGNDFLAKELGRLKTLFRAFRDIAWEREEARNDSNRVTVESHEHLAIVKALLEGDAREAARAMRHHILSGGRYWSRTVHGDKDNARTKEQPHAK
jgi:DNA-binding GntR family transcriptional regulator